MEKRGIDVSSHQGIIDWEKVKSQIDFAILRCGFGGDNPEWDDDQFKINADECTRLDIPFGVYLYSYAKSVESAKSEANHALRMIKGYKIPYPIYIDMEDAKYQGGLTTDLRTDIAITFMEALESNRYFTGIYASLDWFNNKLNDAKLEPYSHWLAQWGVAKPTYDKNLGMWQYSSKGSINGIKGRVDMNSCYADYPSIIKKAGLNGYSVPSITTAPVAIQKPVVVVDNTPSLNINDYVISNNNIVYATAQGAYSKANGRKLSSRYMGQRLRIVNVYYNNKVGLADNGIGFFRVDEVTRNNSTTTLYKVAYGDSLSKIARKFGTTVDKIARDNNITKPDSIRAGIVLKIVK